MKFRLSIWYLSFILIWHLACMLNPFSCVRTVTKTIGNLPGFCSTGSPDKNTGVGCHTFHGDLLTRGSSQVSYISCIGGRFFTTSTTGLQIVQAIILKQIVTSYARGSSLTQGLNLCFLRLLHWQVTFTAAPPGILHILKYRCSIFEFKKF